MSTERAVDRIVTLRPEPNDAERRVAQLRQSRWLLPMATGTAGVIAWATLGGFLFWTMGQRDMREFS